MSKFTPGPWKIGQRRFKDNTLEITEYPGYPSVIARVYPRPHYYSDQDANARLIAAAPDLLAALEAIQADIGGYMEGDWDGNDDGWQALADRARAAIRKATEERE